MSADAATQSLQDAANRALELAHKAGATASDVMASRSTDFEVKVADGAIVTLTQATSKALGLRVFVDGRMGLCSTSDFDRASLEAAVARAVAVAQQTASDPHNGLADAPPGYLAAGPELELFDEAVVALPAEEKIAWAHALEAAARRVDPRVRKFRDSGVATGVAETVLVTSTGASRRLQRTGISVWSTPVAEQDGELQTELWYDSQTHLGDLEPIERVGRIAGERAVRMLGARPIKTQSVPVIFEPAMAGGLVGGMVDALDGDMVYKRASFLADKLGARIASSSLSVIDDPLLRRGAGSAPFDGEGLPTQRRALVDAGCLTTFLYDSYTARKAGVSPTASGRRAIGGLPHAGTFNLLVPAGTDSPEEILRSVPKALLVTRGLGRGVNTVTGEYSRGANGLWIENGEVVHAVQEVTIAGDYLTMLANVDAIGNDLRLRGSVGAPTLRIAEMTVSGS